MSKSSSVLPDSSHLADASIAVRDSEGADIRQSDVNSGRVRELPPPPTTFDRPVQIHAEGPRAGGWQRWWAFVGRRLSSSCGASFLFHFLLLIALAVMVEASRPESAWRGLIFNTNVPVPILEADNDPLNTLRLKPDAVSGNPIQAEQDYLVPEVPNPPEILSPLETANDLHNSQPRSIGPDATRPTDPLLQTDAAVAGMLDGRGRDARATLARTGGGSADSEAAVARGLRWLMAHQREDGSWNFDHTKSSCQGLCRNPGTEASTTAATAMVLLPFLGAGYTHTQGEYQDTIRQGLYYLLKRTLVSPQGNDLQDGTMYAQGLATIALCEAHAMTKDPALKDFAQGAIDFICYAQDAKGGGWRYTPGEPGDMTVTGWQLMGLKSGQMAGLRVPRPTIYLVERFLAGVESDGGSRYGYMDPQPRQTTTAIGLLCRMYTGWRRDHPPLRRGVALLDQWGPSETNMYFNYYATQVMHHWQGPEWERWNLKMRDYLISTQAATSHEAGSWYFPDRHGDKGGRLYNTAMAVMTLEVYYRYLPIYRPRAVKDEF